MQDTYLAGGSALGAVVFWDLRMPSKVFSVFHETQKGDVLSVNFKQQILTAGCDDDSIAVFDLARNESEPLELLLNPEHAVRTAVLAQDGMIYFETLDNYVGCYDFNTGVRKYMHFFENSHANKDTYFVKSNTLSMLESSTSAFTIYNVEGTRIKQSAVDFSGLSEIASYETNIVENVRDCEEIDESLAILSASGDLIFCPKEIWNINNIVKNYHTL